MSIEHSTFVIERTYGASPARVFQAFADPAAKAQWFGARPWSWTSASAGGRPTAAARDPHYSTRPSTATSCRTSGSSTGTRCTPTTG